MSDIEITIDSSKAKRSVDEIIAGLKSVGTAADKSGKDLSGFSRKLGSSFNALSSSVSKTDSSFDELTASVRNTAKAMSAFETSVARSAASMRGMDTSLNDASNSASRFSSIISGVALASFGRDVFQAGVTVQQLNLAFKAIEGDSKKAAEQLNFVREMSNKLGLEFYSAADAYKQLAAASKNTSMEGENTRKIFQAVVSASTALGLSAEKTKLSLYAIQQMMSKGTVQTEELKRQLGEHLPGAFDRAARAMNVTKTQLTDMLKAGKLFAADFLPKFADTLQNEFGPAAESALGNAQQQFNLLKTAWMDFKAALAESGFIMVLVKVFRDLRDVLKSLREFIRANERAVTLFFEAVAQTAKIYVLVKGVGLLVTGFRSLAAIIPIVTRATQFFSVNLVTLGGTAVSTGGMFNKMRDMVVTAMGGATAATKTFNAAVIGLKTTLGVVGAAFAGWEIGSILYDKFKPVKLFGLAMIEGFQDVFLKLSQYVEEFVIVASNLFDKLWNGVKKGVKELLTTVGQTLFKLPDSFGGAIGRSILEAAYSINIATASTEEYADALDNVSEKYKKKRKALSETIELIRMEIEGEKSIQELQIEIANDEKKRIQLAEKAQNMAKADLAFRKKAAEQMAQIERLTSGDARIKDMMRVQKAREEAEKKYKVLLEGTTNKIKVLQKDIAKATDKTQKKRLQEELDSVKKMKEIYDEFYKDLIRSAEQSMKTRIKDEKKEAEKAVKESAKFWEKYEALKAKYVHDASKEGYDSNVHFAEKAGIEKAHLYADEKRYAAKTYLELMDDRLDALKSAQGEERNIVWKNIQDTAKFSISEYKKALKEIEKITKRMIEDTEKGISLEVSAGADVPYSDKAGYENKMRAKFELEARKLYKESLDYYVATGKGAYKELKDAYIDSRMEAFQEEMQLFEDLMESMRSGFKDFISGGAEDWKGLVKSMQASISDMFIEMATKQMFDPIADTLQTSIANSIAEMGKGGLLGGLTKTLGGGVVGGALSGGAMAVIGVGLEKAVEKIFGDKGKSLATEMKELRKTVEKNTNAILERYDPEKQTNEFSEIMEVFAQDFESTFDKIYQALQQGAGRAEMLGGEADFYTQATEMRDQFATDLDAFSDFLMNLNNMTYQLQVGAGEDARKVQITAEDLIGKGTLFKAKNLLWALGDQLEAITGPVFDAMRQSAIDGIDVLEDASTEFMKAEKTLDDIYGPLLRQIDNLILSGTISEEFGEILTKAVREDYDNLWQQVQEGFAERRAGVMLEVDQLMADLTGSAYGLAEGPTTSLSKELQSLEEQFNAFNAALGTTADEMDPVIAGDYAKAIEYVNQKYKEIVADTEKDILSYFDQLAGKTNEAKSTYDAVNAQMDEFFDIMRDSGKALDPVAEVFQKVIAQNIAVGAFKKGATESLQNEIQQLLDPKQYKIDQINKKFDDYKKFINEWIEQFPDYEFNTLIAQAERLRDLRLEEIDAQESTIDTLTDIVNKAKEINASYSVDEMDPLQKELTEARDKFKDLIDTLKKTKEAAKDAGEMGEYNKAFSDLHKLWGSTYTNIVKNYYKELKKSRDDFWMDVDDYLASLKDTDELTQKTDAINKKFDMFAEKIDKLKISEDELNESRKEAIQIATELHEAETRKERFEISAEAARFLKSKQDSPIQALIQGITDDYQDAIQSLENKIKKGEYEKPIEKFFDQNILSQLKMQRDLDIELAQEDYWNDFLEGIGALTLGMNDFEKAIWEENRAYEERIKLANENEAAQSILDQIEAVRLENMNKIIKAEKERLKAEKETYIQTAKSIKQDLAFQMSGLGKGDFARFQFKAMLGQDEYTEEDLNKMAGLIQDTYDEALTGLEEIAEAQTEVADLWKEAAKEAEEMVKSIESAQRDIKYSDLNVMLPKDMLKEADLDYAKLLQAARGGDEAALNEYLGFAEKYLQVAQDEYKSSKAYQDIFAQVMSDMDELKNNIDPQQFIDEQQLAEAEKAVTELQNANMFLSEQVQSLNELKTLMNSMIFSYEQAVTQFMGSDNTADDMKKLVNLEQKYNISIDSKLAQMLADWTGSDRDRLINMKADELVISHNEIREDIRFILEQFGLTAINAYQGGVASTSHLGRVGEVPETIIPLQDGAVPVTIANMPLPEIRPVFNIRVEIDGQEADAEMIQTGADEYAFKVRRRGADNTRLYR